MTRIEIPESETLMLDGAQVHDSRAFTPEQQAAIDARARLIAMQVLEELASRGGLGSTGLLLVEQMSARDHCPDALAALDEAFPHRGGADVRV